MNGMLSFSSSSPASLSQHQLKSIKSPSSSVLLPPLSPHQAPLLKFKGPKPLPKLSVRCSSSSRPGTPGSGETDSRSVLDAFFLGKALAEAINERIESTVGEVLSAVGRLQAEQQKQVQEFQEDVLERAKRAKEKAAREALEAQGIPTKSTTEITSTTTDVVSTVVSPTVITDATPNRSASSAGRSSFTAPNRFNKDPLLGMFDDE